MAQKVQINLVDDLDGGPADETVRFGLDGKNYEIDLSTQNAEELRKAIGEYTVAARKAGTGYKAPKPRVTSHAREIREWASANGIQLSDRGRVSSKIVAAFQEAQSASV